MKALHRFIGCAFALGVLVAAPACGTVALRPGMGGDYRVESQRRGYARGYEVGTDKGRSDARKASRPDYERHKEFRDATKGYNKRNGDRDDDRSRPRRR